MTTTSTHFLFDILPTNQLHEMEASLENGWGVESEAPLENRRVLAPFPGILIPHMTVPGCWFTK
jgi:hypothetical protein